MRYTTNLENSNIIILGVPDRTVYEIDSGSYFVSYNSFKQIRTPVLLMYYQKKNNQCSFKL